MKHILVTERLVLREFTEDDDAFIIELVNSEGWLKYIGDRKIKTSRQAKEYLLNGPIKSYQENGYGLSLVQLKDNKIPIGMCGIINRATLDHPDIGFAFLPQYSQKGFGYEMASRTLEYAQKDLGIDKVLAITIPENKASIRLLTKLGMTFQKSFQDPNAGNELMLFST